MPTSIPDQDCMNVCDDEWMRQRMAPESIGIGFDVKVVEYDKTTAFSIYNQLLNFLFIQTSA